jgi:hypothetical protein
MNIIGPDFRALAFGFTAERVSLLRWSYRHPRLSEAIARYAAAVEANRIEVAAYAVAYWRQCGDVPTLDALTASLPDVLPATHIEVWAGSLAGEYAALRPFVEMAWNVARSEVDNRGDVIDNPSNDGVASINSGVAA